MNLLATINDIFQGKSLKEVSSKLNEFGDLLEYGDWSKNEIIESVDCLFVSVK